MVQQAAPSVILHVDDDRDILEITRIALQVVDSFTLHQFDTADAVLSTAADLSPDLLLLDVMMPGKSGPDLWNALRGMERMAEVPTIFMTAKAEDAIRADLVGMGALHVITKPFDPMTLGEQIRDAWRGRRQGTGPGAGPWAP
ncbi:response regulator [Rhodobacterales bacterium HKCCSP123]|nr:response regulator [Rhodobacterales bacterium HKCCSP123]